MNISLLEYYEEIDHGNFETEKYNLIGVYLTEREAKEAKEQIIKEKRINEEFLFVSTTRIGKIQWEGGFVSV
ncbi:hypothetical protein ACHEVJ_06855 [Enterococcus raffinosus]|uniref:Uncharacterized protein n=1 Tax=Enterococcus raffinosus TaxID=71452 RepID=A0AAW8SWY1_9ENTE|nr:MULTISPECIES: hypothetical protein [Enterococcus]SAM81105.1 hypothetical protein DTPHA_1406921 [Enterococcus faecium]MBS6430368.1 hypothetical protein [Enterococcus raffinosus]MDK7989128.1 hypothetical protein [Enterococcus raffinosus]MDT2536757.1 hypothetical protein [Enterococcus raffinosus]MDT2570571.1 hypothetical protein [Enterococcus raffinosus]